MQCAALLNPYSRGSRTQCGHHKIVLEGNVNNTIPRVIDNQYDLYLITETGVHKLTSAPCIPIPVIKMKIILIVDNSDHIMPGEVNA